MTESKRPTGRLLSIQETAERLGKKASGVRAWIYLRKIPFVKIGRSVRISEEVVQQIIDRGTIPAREGLLR